MSRHILICFFAIITLFSCAKEPAVDSTNSQNSSGAGGYIVSNLSLNIPTEGGDCSFAFHTEDSWSASLINDRADGWLSFTPTSGLSGNVTLKVTASANEGYEDRSATLRLVSGKNTTDLLITQKQKNALLVTTTKYEVAQSGGEITVEVKSNVSYSYTLEDAEGWLSEDTRTRAMETRTLVFKVEPNDEPDRREARIVFSDGTLKEVVSVYQSGGHSQETPDQRILLSEKQITIDKNGGVIKVEAASGRNVSLRIPDGYDWIKEGNHESTNTFYLNIDANESSDNREGFVSFTDVDNGFSENVSIIQLGNNAFAIAKPHYDFGLEGGELNVKIVKGKEIKASTDADWIRYEEGLSSESLLVFSIAQANAGTDRTATITLQCGSSSQTISIRQYPQDDPIHFECQVVKDRLIKLFDLNDDGELSYREAAQVTTMKNVFISVKESVSVDMYVNNDGNIVSRPYTRYAFNGELVDINSITSFEELKYFSGLTDIAPYSFAYMKNLNKITLPAGIKSIGSYAFRQYNIQPYEYDNGVRGLESINLPEGLEKIGDYAFSGCPLSNGISFPSSLKVIGSNAFYHCSYQPKNELDMSEEVIGLKNVVLPESIESVANSAFSYCFALETVEIPSTIKSISYNCFGGCTHLKTISGSAISQDGHSVVNNDGVLLFAIGGKINDFVIPEGVKSVASLSNYSGVLYLNDGNIFQRGSSSLYHYDGSSLTNEEYEEYLIKTIKIPASFEKPISNPFSGLYNLREFKGQGASANGKALVLNDCLVAVVPTLDSGFDIPSSVIEIGVGAFANSGIKEITIPNAIIAIGNYAFSGCSDLKSVVLPKGWDIIKRSMFDSCTNLKDVDGISSITAIEDYGFYGCDSLLTRFKVPSSVTKLGQMSLYSESPGIIEFEALFPPTLSSTGTNYKLDYTTNVFEEVPVTVFGGSTIYVPDLAVDRYQASYYGWENVRVRRLSDLYSAPVFHAQVISEDCRQIIRITEDGKDEYLYHYDLMPVESGSFDRKVPSSPTNTVPVNITNDFYIGATEFPQWLWIDITHVNPSYFHNNNNSYVYDQEYRYYDSDFRPVESISRKDAIFILSELSSLTGLSLRLPSEAEWEYAARGGKYSHGYAYSGGDDLGSVAIASFSNYSCSYTFPCGQRMPNELGLHDMHGNVWEYCSDYNDYYAWTTADTVPYGDDPTGPQEGDAVIRGGSFKYRGSYGGNTEDGFIGNNRNRSIMIYADSPLFYQYYRSPNSSPTTANKQEVGFRPAMTKQQ